MATAKKTVSWKGSAGSQPGQYQNIAVTFKKRAGKKVTCSVIFSARSYGMDSYPSSSRHNHCTLIIKRKTGTDKKGNNTYKQLVTHTWNYACNPGNKVSRSYKNTFSFNLDDDDLTAVYVWYDNNRVGNNIPFKSPKTTGAVNNKFLGKMSAGHPGKVTIKFSSGCINKDARTNLLGGVKNLPASVDIKYGSDFTIPKNVVIAKNGHYAFTGWDVNDKWKTYRKKTTVTKLIRISQSVSSKGKKGKKSVTYEKYETFTRKINTTTPSKKAGAKIKDVKKDITLYACWERVPWVYRYFDTKENATASPLKVLDNTDPTNIVYVGEFNELKQKRLAGKPGVPVPDITTTDPNSKYYKEGYIFSHWRHYLEDGKLANHKPGEKCNVALNACSWPIYTSLACRLIFDYGYDDRVETYYKDNPDWEYTSDLAKQGGVDLSRKCTNKENVAVDPKHIRPGFILKGWSLTQPEKEAYLPGQYSVDFKVDDYYHELATSQVTFYAIWEYDTTLYVYSGISQYRDESTGNYIQSYGTRWHLARPYVYTGSGWKPAQGMVYLNEPEEWKI